MKTINKYDRVASLMLHATTHPSAYTVADTAMKLERIGKRTHRIGTQIVNGEIDRVKGLATMARAVAKAAELVGLLGLTVEESDDGMGYLTVHAKGASNHGIACFGGDT